MTEASLEVNEGMGRRTLLRRAAIGGAAVVWATPVVQTLGQGVAAAGTPVQIACPEGTGSNATPPKSLTWEWTGAGCSPDDGEAFEPGQSTITNSGALPGTVRIEATFGTGQGAGTATFDPVTVGTQFTTTASNGKGLNPSAVFEIWRDGVLERTVSIHTSCSELLFIGDTFCGIELVGGF